MKHTRFSRLAMSASLLVLMLFTITNISTSASAQTKIRVDLAEARRAYQRCRIARDNAYKRRKRNLAARIAQVCAHQLRTIENYERADRSRRR
jgi:hypothetical protein